MKIAETLGCGAELFLLGIVVWSYRFGMVIGVVATLAWLFCGFGLLGYLGWETSNPPEPSPPHKPKEPQFSRLVGSTGTTVSVLNPAGLVEVEGKRIDATSPLGLIEKGHSVNIVGAKGNAIIVNEEDTEANHRMHGIF